LGIKVAHFNNKIENYIYMRTHVAPYGSATQQVNYMAYVNNIEDTKLRGNEYSLDYTVNNFYFNAAYTKMMADNEFCSVSRLGGVVQRTSTVKQYPNQLFSPYVAGAVWDEEVAADCSDAVWGHSAVIPNDRGSLTLGSRWFDDRLDIGMRVRYSPDMGYLELQKFENSQHGSPYTLYDLYGFWQFDEGMRFYVTADNVMNQAYVTAAAATVGQTAGRGRTLVVGFEYRL
jgi:heme acquisition protein HasR